MSVVYAVAGKGPKIKLKEDPRSSLLIRNKQCIEFSKDEKSAAMASRAADDRLRQLIKVSVVGGSPREFLLAMALT